MLKSIDSITGSLRMGDECETTEEITVDSTQPLLMTLKTCHPSDGHQALLELFLVPSLGINVSVIN